MYTSVRIRVGGTAALFGQIACSIMCINKMLVNTQWASPHRPQLTDRVFDVHSAEVAYLDACFN